ncbi:hypothetical protein SAY87_001152 [Trapa incisa]|uniref:Uncharacterized protein n=1 Tax=Trapa incisa TaxID=236973 RepID=A0AAN7JAA0_9MYRT|nr:hypothetical protein SAY87_001152 [Trapa incisa]
MIRWGNTQQHLQHAMKLCYVYVVTRMQFQLISVLSWIQMKDLIHRRPSIAELTGIDESWLECFATYLRAYLMGPAICSNTQTSGSSCSATSTVSVLSSMSKNRPSSSASGSKFPQLRSGSSQASKANSLYQGSLSPRISSFKESTPRSLLCSRISTHREKLKKWAENPVMSVENTVSLPPAGISNPKTGAIVKLDVSNIGSSPLTPPSQVSISGGPSSAQSIFSPYYCWCPPGASTSHLSMSTPGMASPSKDFSHIPSSLIQSAPSALSVSMADLPPFDLPAFLPDPLICLPKPASQQIPTFTPFICDTIVHIPVIDVCSAGQGYLVSAPTTVSTSSISPLHPKLVNPLIPETDPMVEEGARETLRLLLGRSGVSSSPFVGVLPLPAVLTDEKVGSVFVGGSRGLYCGNWDVDVVISSSFPSTIALIPLPECDQHNEPTHCSGGDYATEDADVEDPCNQAEGSS